MTPPINGINEAIEAGDHCPLCRATIGWNRRTDPKPYRGEDPGERAARKAGKEQPGAVYDLVDHLRALARRIEEEGCNSDTVDSLEALKNEAEDLL